MKREHVKTVEIALLVTGLLLTTIFVTAHIHRALLSRTALDTFKATKEHAATKSAGSLWDKPLSFDFSLWSTQRIAAYEESLNEHFEAPLAILRIRKLHLEVPVLSGTDDLTLNRAVGLIAGTSRPGQDGRIGIAGHRDGFFRVLKDIGRGDVVELETLDRLDTYRVDEIVIVKPTDVSVLSPTSSPTLSLVTCYPFYFIGSAPQRYIVMASMERSVKSSGSTEHRLNTTSVRFEPALEPALKDSSPPSQESIEEKTQ
jgi:sortase A